jgi:hypothetical protein
VLAHLAGVGGREIGIRMCHKFICVFAATYDSPVQIDHSHISEIRFVTVQDLLSMARSRSFTPTFLHIIREILWAQLGMKTPSDPAERELLSKLYAFAIDEYRFQVKLNSDRTRDYFAIDLGLIAATTGLFRLENGRAGTLLVMLLFLLGATTWWLAARAVVTGHRYYRQTVFKKTLIEEQLGLFGRSGASDHRDVNLAIGTTPGMANIERIVRDPDPWLKAKLTRGSITFFLMKVLKLLAFVNACGFAAATLRFLRATPPVWNRLTPCFP